MSSSISDQLATIQISIDGIQAEVDAGNVNVATITADLANLTTSLAVVQLEINPLTDPTGSLQAELTAETLQIATISASICYLHGTHILTERGEVAVEDLKVGDRVVTPHAAQASMPIRWIGRQHFEGDATRFTQQVLVRAGALGDGMPHRDLRVSADHCLYLDGRLVPAKLLANGSTIVAERGQGVLDFVNIELDQHTIVVAEGIESETYLDCGNRARFHNAAEPSEWVASRLGGSPAAWHDGSAFAEPLWSGPALEALVARLAALPDIAIAA